MENRLFRCNPEHPCRPPNWRWEKARILSELGKRIPARGIDSFTRTAYRFQKDLEATTDTVERYYVYERAGTVAMAFDIWDSSGGQSDSYQPDGFRHELEARLLAGQTPEEISAKLGASTAVIKTYGKLFFDLDDRIDKPGYVVHQILGPKLHQGMSDANFPTLLKAYAYFTKSPELIDAMVTTFPANATPSKEGLSNYLVADARWSACRKAALAARMFTLNNFSKSQLMALTTRLIEIEKESELSPATGPDNTIIGNVQAMLNQVKLVVGQDSPAEVRASEVLAIAAGKDIPDLKEYANFTYPEPSGKK